MKKNDKKQAASENEQRHDESVRRIISAVKQNMTFSQAARLVEIEDKKLRAAVEDDALKVMIAEMHFSGGTPLDKLSSTIKLPLKALEKAKAEMLMDIQATAIEKYREESDMEFPKGEA